VLLKASLLLLAPAGPAFAPEENSDTTMKAQPLPPRPK
jgi:hypothetical protein